jgi:hypothetical protein
MPAESPRSILVRRGSSSWSKQRAGECGPGPDIGQTIVGGEGGKVFTLDLFALLRYNNGFASLEYWQQDLVVAEAWCRFDRAED